MSGYRRIVSYLYKYSNGKKTENTGFIRAEMRESGLRLHIHLKDPKMVEEKVLKVYFYFHKDDRLKTVFVDEFLVKRGSCEYKKVINEEGIKTDFGKMAGMVFYDSKGLLYGSCWDDVDIEEERLDRDNRTVQKEVTECSKPVEQEEKIKTDSPMQALLDSLPKIYLNGSSNLVEAGRMHLNDISKLSFKDWKLAENAFLQQAYEDSGYLLFGKVILSHNREIWVLGVPGRYDNREKYLANIFGFSHYIPEETEKFWTGGQGYWIMELYE